MNNISFSTTDDQDFAATFDLTDDATNANFNASALEWTFQVTDCGSAKLTAKTEDATMTRPATYQLAFRFSKAQVASALCVGQTYKCGLAWTNGSGNIGQIATGTVTITDGGMA